MMSPRALRPLRQTSGGPRSRGTDRLFVRLAGITQALFLGLGALLMSVEVSRPAPPPLAAVHGVTFEVTPKPVAAVTPEPPAPAALPELTPETLLNQAVERAAPEPEPESAPRRPAAEETAPAPAPRRVYGVRKVFARGLGSGGGGRGGLVVKRGNILDGRPDTLTATAADLDGSLAALSTVNRAPEPVKRSKPRYSRALRENRVSGTVTARLLIDVDGRVKQVEVLADIGFDSRELAVAAFQEFRFRPALRAGEPVAVWITHKIRFEFQE